MTREQVQLDRRSFLRGSLATAALLPLAGTLASCSGSSPSGGGGGGGGGGTKTARNPFGVAKTSRVEAGIFKRGLRLHKREKTPPPGQHKKGISRRPKQRGPPPPKPPPP